MFQIETRVLEENTHKTQLDLEDSVWNLNHRIEWENVDRSKYVVSRQFTK